MLGVYVHIPFCERKCCYCGFSSFVVGDEEKNRYIDFLIEEIKNFHKKYPQEKYRKIDTIYFGGGTPSLLSSLLFEKLAVAIKDNFEFAKNYEWTVECNPNSLTEVKLESFKKVGVNRISLGVQSLDDDKLKFVGRLHNSEEAKKAIVLAKKYFDNVSCDMLIGLAGMDKEKLIDEVDELLKLGIKHISTYMLQVERNTPLERMVEKQPALLPDDDECVDAYEEVASFLDKRGFERYEVSNFALRGFESRHNLKYWTGEEYVGFGLSAHSYLENIRSSCADGLSDFYAHKRSLFEKLGNTELIEEHVMLGLRCKMGISKSYIASLGFDLSKNKNLASFLQRGVIFQKPEEDDRLYLNPKFYGVNNYIIASILAD